MKLLEENKIDLFPLTSLQYKINENYFLLEWIIAPNSSDIQRNTRLFLNNHFTSFSVCQRMTSKAVIPS